MSRFAALGVSLGVAALELSHPAWPASVNVVDAVTASGGWWIPLHVLLMLGFGALLWLNWRLVGGAGRWLELVLAAAAAINLVYLAVDGVAVGILAASEPELAVALWESPLVNLLANAAGASWAASLLATAFTLLEQPARRFGGPGFALAWLTLVASIASPPLAAASRLVALAAGTYAVYASGVQALPVGLLAFASVLRQHVGGEAAFGILCVGVGLSLRPSRRSDQDG